MSAYEDGHKTLQGSISSVILCQLKCEAERKLKAGKQLLLNPLR